MLKSERSLLWYSDSIDLFFSFLFKRGEKIVVPVIISSIFNYIALGIFLSLAMNVAYK